MQKTRSGLQAGTVARARGARWRVDGVTPFDDCEAVALTAPGQSAERRRTLLIPFDRVVPIAGRRVPRKVSWRRLAARFRRAAADATPADGIGTAASAHIDLFDYQLEPALAV